MERSKVNSGKDVAIPDKELQQVAKECALRLGITRFKASSSWLRGWKGRCQEEGLVVKGRGKRSVARRETVTQGNEGSEEHAQEVTREEIRRGDHDNHTQATPTSSQQLSMLTEEERRGVARVGPRRGVVGKEAALSFPDNQLYAESAEQVYVDYNAAECSSANTSMSCDQSSQQSESVMIQSHDLSHDHSAQPANSSACFQVCLGDLLGELQAHDMQSHDMQSPDPQVQLGLHLGEEVGVAEVNEPQDNALLSLSNNELSQQSFPLPECHVCSAFSDHAHSEFPEHAPSLLEAEEEQLMSVFNHRSFTDHFPFLPPTLFSNWCPPYDQQDASQHHTPTQDRPGMRSKVGTSAAATCPEGMTGYQVQTRSRARAKAAAASVSTGPSVASLSGTALPPPSLDTDSPPPPTRGGVSLLSSPSRVGGVVSSPPGGGLLANRLSQPTFPDEPEIIFHEIQLGPLHTCPAPIAATPPQQCQHQL